MRIILLTSKGKCGILYIEILYKAVVRLKGLLRSFVYAFNGVKHAVMTQRNFRIHLAAIFFTLYFSFLYGLEAVQYGILALILLIVPALELVNTAIENVVNLKTESFNEFAKIAKDSAAAAVLIAAIGSLGVAVSLFSDVEKLKNAIGTAITLPHLIILLFTAAFWIYFIFFLGKKRDK